jgi:glutamyl-Q tRNA(Asp) synthetase
MTKGPDFLPMPEPGEPATVTRFAPTPSGYLHLGHAYSALVAWEAARSVGGRFLLRMEDIDRQRCRPEFEQGICDDLRWLGLYWDGPVVRQSDRMDLYDQALSQLDCLGVLYPCFCTRRRIRVSAAA